MKAFKIAILYLIIYTFIPTSVYSQNLELKIIGKDTLENHIIDSLNYKTSFKDYNALINEIEITHERLQNLGYIESRIISTTKPNDSLYVSKLELNNKYYTLRVYYDPQYFTIKQLNEISSTVTPEYFTIPISETENALSTLNKAASDKGFPFASFQLKNITKEKNNVIKGELIVNFTSKRNINNVVIKGYENFSKSFLTRFLKIKTGQTFNLTKLKASSEKLTSLPFAQQIKDPEILFTQDSTTLYLYLKKRKSNTFDGFLGFGNNDETNKLEFNGYLNLKLLNNLNYGESFELVYKSDENEQRSFNINTDLPYLFQSPLGLNLNLNIFKKDSTYSIVSQSAKLIYQINDKNRIYSGVNVSKSDNLLNDTNTLIQDYNSTFISTAFEHTKTTSNFLFPIQSQLLLQGEFGSRKLDNVKENQTMLNLKFLNIFNLNTRNSIYIGIQGKTLFSDQYLANELHRFGGINSIRGFEENSISSTLNTIFNSEYRYLLSNGLYAHTIIDGAYYEDRLNDVKEKLFGFGFGIGIITRSGLFKLNYANGLTENQPFKLDNSKIHISLNAFF